MPSSTLQVVFTSILIAWLSAPFIFAYLIANDPLFDPRRLLVGGLPYALLSGVLAAIYLAVVLGGQRLFASVTGEQTLIFSLLAALLLAFAFAPLRERVQLGIDRIYGRDPVALRKALDQAGRELLSALDPDMVRAVGRGRDRRAACAGRCRIRWPGDGPPRLAEPEVAPDHARGRHRGAAAAGRRSGSTTSRWPTRARPPSGPRSSCARRRRAPSCGRCRRRCSRTSSSTRSTRSRT